MGTYLWSVDAGNDDVLPTRERRWVLLRVLLRVLFLRVICLSVFGPFFCFVFFKKIKKNCRAEPLCVF